MYRQTSILILMVTALLISPATATIWRLSNVTGADADFTDFATAHSTASAGDTIYVEGSATSYGTVTTAKQLTIIGPGYFLAENPETQASTVTASFGGITILSASAGSMLQGCEFSNIRVYANNVLVKSNGLTQYGIDIGDGSAISGVTVIQNYVRYSGGSVSSNATNITISNNYFRGGFYGATSSPLSIYNNIFASNITVYTSVLNNNVMTGGTFSGTNNIYNNNLANGTQFGTDNGNQANVNMDNEFLGAFDNSTDGQWQLRAGAVAIGAGLNGEDCGMFGGSTPYVLSGLIDIPSILELSTTGPGTTEGGLDVHIRAKSH